MKLRVAAIGQRAPAWVIDGWNEYARRFPPHLPLELRAIAAQKRSRNATVEELRRREGEKLIAAVEPGCRCVALDEKGRQWSTMDLAEKLTDWTRDGRDITFLIGGADGLSSQCLDQAEYRWSLGKLTLPHMLVRVILAEQLYRAWTVTQNHPYHRA